MAPAGENLDIGRQERRISHEGAAGAGPLENDFLLPPSELLAPERQTERQPERQPSPERAPAAPLAASSGSEAPPPLKRLANKSLSMEDLDAPGAPNPGLKPLHSKSLSMENMDGGESPTARPPLAPLAGPPVSPSARPPRIMSAGALGAAAPQPAAAIAKSASSEAFLPSSAPASSRQDPGRVPDGGAQEAQASATLAKSVSSEAFLPASAPSPAPAPVPVAQTMAKSASAEAFVPPSALASGQETRPPLTPLPPLAPAPLPLETRSAPPAAAPPAALAAAAPAAAPAVPDAFDQEGFLPAADAPGRGHATLDASSAPAVPTALSAGTLDAPGGGADGAAQGVGARAGEAGPASGWLREEEPGRRKSDTLSDLSLGDSARCFPHRGPQRGFLDDPEVDDL